MKKIQMLAIVLLTATMLTGCFCLHKWEEATCEVPKTCNKCDATEGEPLGHDWMDADCENPKTCEECGATEGEPLGHTLEEWGEVSDSVMSALCDVCGSEVKKKMDRSLLSENLLLGKWYVSGLRTEEEEWITWRDNSVWIEFYENGEFRYRITEETSGTYTFAHYNEEYRNYWYTAYFDDNSGWCEFRYTSGERDLYWVSDKMWLCFERR